MSMGPLHRAGSQAASRIFPELMKSHKPDVEAQTTKKAQLIRRQSGAIKSSNSLHILFTLQTFVKVPLTEASHLTYFISFNLYSHTWRSVLSVQLCRPGV